MRGGGGGPLVGYMGIRGVPLWCYVDKKGFIKVYCVFASVDGVGRHWFAATRWSGKPSQRAAVSPRSSKSNAGGTRALRSGACQAHCKVELLLDWPLLFTVNAMRVRG